MTAKIDGTNGVLQAYDYQTPTTGFSYTFAAGTQVLVMNPAGTLATGTITMPASPADGMVISASSTKAITALTVNANTGQTINNAPTTLIAGGSFSFVYRASSTSWFPFNSANSSYVGSGGQAFTSNGTFTIPTGITALKVTVVGGGGGSAGSGANGGSGGNSSIQSGTQTITTVTGNGGGGGLAGVSYPVTAGGSASNGTLNIPGGTATPFPNGSGGGTSILSNSNFVFSGTYGGGAAKNYGGGGAGTLYGCLMLQGGGGGGSAIVWLTGLTPGNTISVTVGGGGTAGTGTPVGYAGAGGVVIFEW